MDVSNVDAHGEMLIVHLKTDEDAHLAKFILEDEIEDFSGE